MKKYFVIIPLLFITYFLTLNFNEKSDKKNSEVEKEIKNEVKNEDNKINSNIDGIVNVFYENENYEMNLDEYIIGVLACEMPASFDDEALKAGAVAIRTFYVYKKVHYDGYVASSTDQCFVDTTGMKNKWGNTYDKYYNIIKNAVYSTKNEVLSYDNEVIQSFYFSLSNGYTENLENVFSDSRPYLVSVESLWDKNVSNYEKSIEFSKSEFLSRLGLPYSNDINISISSRSESGRINNILINGIEFRGVTVRKLLSIRSTDFDIKAEGEKVIIVTRGYGHGVGMSQYGANEMAKLGYTYDEILKHYYSGVDISLI